MAKQTFAYQFELNALSGPGFGLRDDSALPGLQPMAMDVRVRGEDDARKILGRDDDESFTVGVGRQAREYDYLGTASDASGKVIGIVGEYGGKRFLFTDETNLSTTTRLTLNEAGEGPQWSLTKGGPVCFMPGTLVRTPDGEAAVETLAAGDLVLTSEGAIAPIRWIGRQTVSRVFADPLRVLPIRIQAGALGNGLPLRDLLVSADHALLVDGLLVHAGALVNGTSIRREAEVPAVFTYYHVELHDHALVLAEGTPAETFVDNVDRMAFDNWDEHEAAGAAPAPIAEMALPRVRSARQLPTATRRRLMAVAQELFPAEAAATAA